MRQAGSRLLIDRHQAHLAHEPEALDKKSRSTTSSPILAWSLEISASRRASGSPALSSKTRASFSTACFFQSPIRLGCRACRLASSAMVCSPRMASRATLALNSAVYRFRFDIVNRPRPGDPPYPPVPFSGTSSLREGLRDGDDAEKEEPGADRL